VRAPALGLRVSLVGFVVASLVGLTGAAIVSACDLLQPAGTARRSAICETFQAGSRRRVDAHARLFLRPTAWSIRYFVFYCGDDVLLWKVFDRAVIEDGGGISTGLLNNFGDLPFHISVITSFAFGNNFPPEDPTYAGVSSRIRFCPTLRRHVCALRRELARVDVHREFHAGGGVCRSAASLGAGDAARQARRDHHALIVLLNGGLGWYCCLRRQLNGEVVCGEY
jgi:hypothetical protein